MATTLDLGKLGLTFKGNYDPVAIYEPLDLVFENGSTYICKKDVQGYPVSNREYWDLFTAGTGNVLHSKGHLLFQSSDGPASLNIGEEGNFLRAFNKNPRWGMQTSRPGKLVAKLMKGGSYGNSHHAAFLMKDGSIKAVGRSYGKSNGSADDKHYWQAQNVVIDPSNPPTASFKDIYAGHNCYFALTEDGQVFSWGWNDFGQLGHGDNINRAEATRINYFVNNNITIVDIVVPSTYWWGYNSIYFITDQGEVYATGYNGYGQLGNGTKTNQNVPVRCGTFTGIKQIAVNQGRYCGVYVIDANGDLWSWGYNGYGQLGHGDTTQRDNPEQVVGISGVNRILVIGDDAHSDGAQPCAFTYLLMNNGDIMCCGYNGFGQLGQGDTTQRNSFVPLSGSFVNIKDLAIGGGWTGFVGLIDDSDELWTWGHNNFGQLGLGDITHRYAPNKPVADFQGKVARVIAAGNYHYNFFIVLTTDGELWAAGYGDWGQLASGIGHLATNNLFKRMKAPIPYSNMNIVDIRIAGYGAEATPMFLLDDGRVLACGCNNYGQTGTRVASSEEIDELHFVKF